jgi:hypothetical protein
MDPIALVPTDPLLRGVMLVLVAACVSFLASLGGLSGAFLLMPFQISVLGFTGAAVTPTNHLFNVVGIPSGVLRYGREGRMVGPLAAVVALGTVPGVILGSMARVSWLADPRHFKLFVGLVMALIASRLLDKARRGLLGRNASASPTCVGPVEVLSFDWRCIEYRFSGEMYRVSVPALFALSLVIGVIGGAYGIGGGAIIGPFLISWFGLPVFTTAGATLLGTFLSSLTGVVCFTVAGLHGHPELLPDWGTGLLLGLGGMVGIHFGASLQKHLPATLIEALLGVMVLGIALHYVVGAWGGR